MGYYLDRVVPFFCDRAMDAPELRPVRAALLAPTRGDVLEIGFGTGLNLPHYPPAVTRLMTVDVVAGMNPYAQRRIARSPIVVEQRLISAESLPFPDAGFDFVVSTWTLCSIPDVAAALQEVRRVLRPGGRFLFVEHGLAPDPGVARCQHTLNPLQKFYTRGCHLNRDMAAILHGSGLTVELEQYYFPGHPRILGYTTRGHAAKPR